MNNRNLFTFKLKFLILLILNLQSLLFAVDISNILDLWNVRNNLGGSYTLINDLNLELTNPALISDYQNNTDYSIGDIVKYSDSFAYYCTVAHNSATTFSSANWVKMWESAKGWEPIGNATNPFYGRFDGNHHIIYNLYINRKASPTANNVYPSDGEDFVGLFGVMSNGTSSTSGAGTNYDVYIKNLGLLNPNVSGRRATGSLMGRVILPYTLPNRTNIAFIENCFAKADGVGGSAQVNGFGSTGGLVGANNSDRKLRIPIIRFSYADVEVSATHPYNQALNPYDEIEDTFYNPYNIKYGGLVGCNENGSTQDSYALGNVSGGDRVGGVAGCSIGGAVFRSYATGTLIRNIQPGNYQGGIGGVVGISSGYLPPALGGTNAYGSVEDAYWDTTSSGVFTSAGGIGMPTANFSNQNNFNNWDFLNVWEIISSYPTLKNSPITNFHFRTKETGNYSSFAIWDYSANESSWISAVTYPDLTNANSITIQNGHTVNIYNNWYISNTLVQNGGKIIIANGQTLFIENSSGDDLVIQGDIDVNGNLVLGQSATMRGDTGSEISFLGSDIISFPSGVSSLYNILINNPNGVSFGQNISINGVLEEINGQFVNSATTNINGLLSAQERYLDIDSATYLINNFSANTSLTGAYPQYIKREWDIQGTIDSALESDRQREVTFYWDASDDGDYLWQDNNQTPILFLGLTQISPQSFVVDSPQRQATYIITFNQSSKAGKSTYRIGLEADETLPVTLSSFLAQVIQSDFVQVTWTSQSESNLLGYHILRNNQNNLDSAQTLAFLEATNSSETYTYKYIDSAIVEEGEYFYWLKSSEYDGSSNIFGPVRVELKDNPEDEVIDVALVQGVTAIYPNPFNPSTTINFNINEEEEVKLEIYNLKGQRVKVENFGNLSKGQHSHVWNAVDASNKQLPSGIYFSKINIGNKYYFNKMILMK